MKRRKFIRNAAFTVGLVTVSGAIIRLTKSKSMDYSDYFKKLNFSLRNYKRSNPFLIVDLDKLDNNIDELKKLIPTHADYRIVVKSLPSIELINYVQNRAKTNKLMVFNQSFLSQLSLNGDEKLDILFGKPMPVRAAQYYYQTLQTNKGFDPSKQVQWLVDTEKRIHEYIGLAKSIGQKILLNIEIDVGLHRGGFDNIESLRSALNSIKANQDYVAFSGFMGYDPHIVKVPSILLSRVKAFNYMKTFYNDCKSLVETEFPELWNKNLTFNGAGSPTVSLHNTVESPLNDISAGSFAVKPTDFDIDTLESFAPASFIATPILKKYDNTTLPSVEKFDGILNLFDPNMEQSYYIFGGSWMADYYEPKGLKSNPIFGKSTNQIMLNSSENTKLDVDDFVFLRPHQSEFVFLQFGEILCIRDANIVDEWSVLNV